MAYYLYENWQQRKVRIHLGECGHCLEGYGRTGLGPETPNGSWHGPYETAEAALGAGRGLGHPDVRACRACSRWEQAGGNPEPMTARDYVIGAPVEREHAKRGRFHD